MMPLNGTKRHRARACTQRGARAGMCLPALLYAFAVYLIEADGCTYVLYLSVEGAVLGPYRGVPEQEVSVGWQIISCVIGWNSYQFPGLWLVSITNAPVNFTL